MPRALVLEFTKMNGAGNDFIVLDNRFYTFSDDELSDLARRYCPRRTGIGADGLLALSPPQSEGAAFRMRYFNADGSRATMCGNGARCLARFARYAGMEQEELLFDSDAGLYRAYLPADLQAPVRLFVPPPQRFTESVPVESDTGGQAVHFIWTGTDHAVMFVPEVETVSVASLGHALRFDEAFQPAGTNVDFVSVTQKAPATVRMRTYERGVEAETLACGTGALASALVARLTGQVEGDAVTVLAPGGTLRVGFRLEGGGVHDLWLEGPAEVVYRGTVEV